MCEKSGQFGGKDVEGQGIEHEVYKKYNAITHHNTDYR